MKKMFLLTLFYALLLVILTGCGGKCVINRNDLWDFHDNHNFVLSWVNVVNTSWYGDEIFFDTEYSIFDMELIIKSKGYSTQMHHINGTDRLVISYISDQYNAFFLIYSVEHGYIISNLTMALHIDNTVFFIFPIQYWVYLGQNTTNININIFNTTIDNIVNFLSTDIVSYGSDYIIINAFSFGVASGKIPRTKYYHLIRLNFSFTSNETILIDSINIITE